MPVSLSSHKDIKKITGYTAETEVTSTMETREIDGCIVTFEFSDHPNPAIQTKVAEIIMSSYMDRRNGN